MRRAKKWLTKDKRKKKVNCNKSSRVSNSTCCVFVFTESLAAAAAAAVETSTAVNAVVVYLIITEWELNLFDFSKIKLEMANVFQLSIHVNLVGNSISWTIYYLSSFFCTIYSIENLLEIQRCLLIQQTQLFDAHAHNTK